jgi:hypothetical protein
VSAEEPGHARPDLVAVREDGHVLASNVMTWKDRGMRVSTLLHVETSTRAEHRSG